jgi:hypothetical protein
MGRRPESQGRLPVLTRDEHFDVVPGLHREGW